MKKKLLSILLAASLAVTSLTAGAFTVFADDEEEPADEEADETEAAEDAAENEEIKEEK